MRTKQEIAQEVLEHRRKARLTYKDIWRLSFKITKAEYKMLVKHYDFDLTKLFGVRLIIK